MSEAGRSSRFDGAPDPFAERIAPALVDAVFELGYERASMAEVAARAGIGIAELEARYSDKEECVLRVYEALIDDFLARTGLAYDRGASWREALRDSAYAAADWIEEHPRATRFGMVDVLRSESEMVRVRREEIFKVCAELIDAGRADAPDPESIPESAPVLAIGAIAEMLTRRLQSGAEAAPRAMVPEMMCIAVRPYLGEEVAREELSIPPPPRSHAEPAEGRG